MPRPDVHTPPDRQTPPAPRWIRWAAYATPLCVLPSALWRLLGPTQQLWRGVEPCAGGSVIELFYVPSLSVVSLALAWLTVGLVRPWGETLPRWLPLVGGRRVDPRAAVAAALGGAALLTALLVAGWAGDGQPRHALPPGCHPPGSDVLVWYAPLVLWPPLLVLVALDHARRHRVFRRR